MLFIGISPIEVIFDIMVNIWNLVSHINYLWIHFSTECILGNVTIAPAPVVGKVSSPSTLARDPSVIMNGLSLIVWPQVVDGLKE